MPQQGLFQELALRQELQLAPHQILSLEILTVPLLDLQSRINQELENNPTLERVESMNEKLIGDPVESETASASKDSDLAAAAAEKDDYINNLMRLDDSWQDYLPPGHARQFSSQDDEERRRYFFDTLTTEKTLEEDLLEQLRMSDAEDELVEYGELLIGNIDETGYLRANLEELAGSISLDRSEGLKKLEAALELVQSFEPPGIGARDLRECLLIQLERSGKKGTLVYKIVDKYLEDISRNRIPQVAKALNISTAELYDSWRDIQKLQPRPGSAASPGGVQYVVPEVTISKEDGAYEVSSNRDYMPKLSISKQYRAILEDPNTANEIKQYVRDKINSGKLLMKSLSQRESTVHRISEIILKRQKEFFENGDESMKPMTMNQVAEEIGVHETTVSRAIANKYIQTPHGMLPLRHFFSGGYQSENGEMLSNRSIKHKIQAMVSEEDPKKPLSDQKIVEMLKEEGLKVARRTVAKYREELGIPSSHLRKSHAK